MDLTTPATERVVAVLDHLDLAEPSDAVLWAASHAAARKLPLHVIHVARVPVLAGAAAAAAGVGPGTGRSDGLGAGQEAQLWRPFVGVVKRLQADNHGLEVTVQIVSGGVDDTLAAQIRRTDLLVTEESIIRAAGDDGVAVPLRTGCPVVVVPAGTLAAPTSEIVLGVDAAFSRAAADVAFAVATDLRIPVRAVYTTGSSVSYLVGLSGRGAQGDRGRVGFDRSVRTAGGGYPGVSPVTADAFAIALAQACRSSRLVVVGVDAGESVDAGGDHVRAVNPVLATVLADSSCPVVLVPSN